MVELNTKEFGLIKKFGSLTTIINLALILAFAYFSPIMAYYLGFFAPVFFWVAVRSAYVKTDIIENKMFTKFVFLLLIIIPNYIAFYIYFDGTFGLFSGLIAAMAASVLCISILKFFLKLIFTSLFIKSLLIYCVILPSLPSFIQYLFDDGSSLLPILGLAMSTFWQISISMLLSNQSLYKAYIST